MPSADLPKGDKTINMSKEIYYVYVLKSAAHNRIYVGSSQDVIARLKLHNSGRVKSTKPYRPWILLEKHLYKTRGEAVKFEKYFKTGQQKEFIKRRHGL
jgi:putative endonuclease